MSGRTPSLRRSRARRRSAGRRGDPIDVWQAEGWWRSPSPSACATRSGGLAVYDARDLATQSARFARLPGPWRALLAAPRARLGAEHGRGRDGQHALRRRAGARLGPPAADRSGTAPPTISPPTRPDGCGTSAWDSPAGTPVVLYLGLVLDGRGIGQLCEAIGLVPGRRAGGRRLRRRLRALPGRGREPATRGPDPLPGARGARRHPRLHRRRGCVRDARGGRHPQPPAQHADQAVRCHGRGRARWSPATCRAWRPSCATPAAASCAIRADPADIARAIRAIVEAPPERRAAYRAACLAAARDVYAWEHQAPVLLDLYRSLSVGSLDSCRCTTAGRPSTAMARSSTGWAGCVPRSRASGRTPTRTRLLAGTTSVEPGVQAGRGIPYRQVLAEALAAGRRDRGSDRAIRSGARRWVTRCPSWPVFPEVPAALTELRRRGWRLAILSNTRPGPAGRVRAGHRRARGPAGRGVRDRLLQAGARPLADLLPRDRRRPRAPRPCRRVAVP